MRAGGDGRANAVVAGGISIFFRFTDARGISCTHLPAPGRNGKPILKAILQYLKTHGERSDSEIAEAVGLSLTKVRAQLNELAEQREVMLCHSTRFEKGKKIESIKCRLAGYIPPAAPGRKSKSQLVI